MSLELILGPMFAGKSSAVCQVIRRNRVIGRPTMCITSALDTRYTTEPSITSHNKESFPATATKELLPILQLEEFVRASCIIVEEAQFFSDLKEFVLEAVDVHGKNVICVGLDGDSDRKPFGQLLDLIPYADKIQKLSALCTKCHNGKEAIFTFRKPGSLSSQVDVGGQDKYAPLCRMHYLESKRELTIDQFVHEENEKPQEKEDHVLKQFERCVKRFGAKDGAYVYQQILIAQGRLPSTR